MPLPNFLLVGAAKCGTTTIMQYLRNHPQVFIPKLKEPHYLVAEIFAEMRNCGLSVPEFIVEDSAKYLSLFNMGEGAKAIGEGSVIYLPLWRQSIPRIKALLGDPKIIITVRNPVDRLYSHYRYLYPEHSPSDTPNSFRTFYTSKNSFLDRLVGDNYYVYQGRYADLIQAYKANFSKVHIVMFEDLVRSPSKVMREIYQFLDLDEHVAIVKPIWRMRGYQRFSPHVHRRLRAMSLRLWPRLETFLSEKQVSFIKQKCVDLAYRTPRIPNPQLQELAALYKPEISKAEEILGRSLEEWRVK